MVDAEELYAFWAPSARRGIHVADEAGMRAGAVLDWSPQGAAQGMAALRVDKRQRRLVHRHLYPQPYVGDLRQARVFILCGNPGFDGSEYVHDYGNQGHMRALEKSLRGEASNFYFLAEPSSRTGGGQYWLPRLQPLIADVAAALPAGADAADLVRSRVAVIESFAYHSMNHPGDWVDHLKSSQLVKRFVKETLVPSAITGSVLLFVWRRARFWAVTEASPNIVSRDPRRARSSYMFEEERSLITRFLVKWRSKDESEIVSMSPGKD